MTLCSLSPSLAGWPEPDNVIYGTLAFGGVPVTAQQTGVTVEARRGILEVPIASYRMGDDPQAGDFYSLALPLESGLPLDNPNALLVGESVLLLVRDSSGREQYRTTYTVADRGWVTRIDFGAVSPDLDEDGLVDEWELAWFGHLGIEGGSITANGLTAYDNYVAGTDPNDPDSGFAVQVAVEEGEVLVSFDALRAEGPGYDGRTRHYRLEQAQELPAEWLAEPGYGDFLGDNQKITFASPATNPLAWYRGRVWLEP